MKIQLSENHTIGEDEKVFFIAEAGINHNGSMETAKQLINLAKECNADCVKFQKRTINKILTKQGLEKDYENCNSYGKTYGEHKEFLEFDFEQFKELKAYADETGILFTASGWDVESVDFLDELGVPFFKMASADLTNFPLIIHTAKKNKPMILSTGMADMDIVKKAYELVTQYNSNIIIMQCTSSYPTPENQINLNVIKTYEQEFPSAVIGYSGHENGISISQAAVCLGAKIIERHYTLDRSMKGGDHAASLEKSGLEKLIRNIHEVSVAMGSHEKTLQPSEGKCFEKLSKSIVSINSIPANTTITREMLTTKGPGISKDNDGISPMFFEDTIGRVTNIDIERDVMIKQSWLK